MVSILFYNFAKKFINMFMILMMLLLGDVDMCEEEDRGVKYW